MTTETNRAEVSMHQSEFRTSHGREYQPASEDTLREAWRRYHRVAVFKESHSLMSIPADERVDADLLINNAITELVKLRAENILLRTGRGAFELWARFDCGHTAEDACACGDTEQRLWRDALKLNGIDVEG